MADKPTSGVRKRRTRSTPSKRTPRAAAAKKGVSVKGTDGAVTTIVANTPAGTDKAAEKQAAAFGLSWFDTMTAWQKNVSGAMSGQSAAMSGPTAGLEAMQNAWLGPMQAWSGALSGGKSAMPDPTESLEAMQKAWLGPMQAFSWPCRRRPRA